MVSGIANGMKTPGALQKLWYRVWGRKVSIRMMSGRL